MLSCKDRDTYDPSFAQLPKENEISFLHDLQSFRCLFDDAVRDLVRNYGIYKTNTSNFDQISLNYPSAELDVISTKHLIWT